MNNHTDIHQLDLGRQVLFILNENSGSLSIQEIKDKLIAHDISPETRSMKSFLLYTLGDRRTKFIKNGLVLKTNSTYQIMQKGIDCLKSTVIVIDPAGEKSKQETTGRILSGLSGNIKLCDPYFDDVAYNLIKQHLHSGKVKSIKIIYSTDRIDSVKTYKIGNQTIELKKKKKIHDRFLIDDQYLYFLGASLNSMGEKLSFIFNLTAYKNTFDDIFENMWNKS